MGAFRDRRCKSYVCDRCLSAKRLLTRCDVASVVRVRIYKKRNRINSVYSCPTAVVAQLVEPQIVTLVVAGSSPVDRPPYQRRDGFPSWRSSFTGVVSS